jgi:hypothetical protein
MSWDHPLLQFRFNDFNFLSFLIYFCFLIQSAMRTAIIMEVAAVVRWRVREKLP